MKKKKELDVNSTQFKSLLQYIATAGASFVAGKGWLSQDQASELFNWFVIGLPILIGIWQARDAGRLKEAAKVKDKNGDHVQIVAPDALANAVPKDNVVPASTVKVVAATEPQQEKSK
jgi:hypothetical protein